ncbi:6-phosphogluconolactonase [Desulfobaculum senezii]
MTMHPAYTQPDDYAVPGAQALVFATREAMAREAARRIAEACRAAVSQRGVAALMLAGGSTPRRTYELLAQEADMPWADILVFYGDERMVPPDDPASNAHMAHQTLLSRVPLPAANVMRIAGESGDAAEAAAQYEAILRGVTQERGLAATQGVPVLDVVLLGMGDDGHTASLFPYSTALDERARLVVPALAPPDAAVSQRVTITLPLCAAARLVVFLATGPHKAGIVREMVTQPAEAARRYPAAQVVSGGDLLWLLAEVDGGGGEGASA